jgi:hypothetical protein
VHARATWQHVQLDHNRLVGALPRSLASLGGSEPMQLLALSHNSFDYDASVNAELITLVQRCKNAGCIHAQRSNSERAGQRLSCCCDLLL